MYFRGPMLTTTKLWQPLTSQLVVSSYQSTHNSLRIRDYINRGRVQKVGSQCRIMKPHQFSLGVEDTTTSQDLEVKTWLRLPALSTKSPWESKSTNRISINKTSKPAVQAYLELTIQLEKRTQANEASQTFFSTKTETLIKRSLITIKINFRESRAIRMPQLQSRTDLRQVLIWIKENGENMPSSYLGINLHLIK